MVDLETTILRNKFALSQYGSPLVEASFTCPILGSIARTDHSMLECGLVIETGRNKFTTLGIRIPSSFRILAQNASFEQGEQDWRVKKVDYGGDETEVAQIRLRDGNEASATTVNVRRLHQVIGTLIYEPDQIQAILGYLDTRRVPEQAVKGQGSLALSTVQVQLYDRMTDDPIVIKGEGERNLHIAYPDARYHVAVGYPVPDTTIGTITLPAREINVTRIPIHHRYIGGAPSGAALEVFKKVVE